MAYRLGVDIGGTFTDIALIDEATGQIYTGKVSSTPQDPSGGFMEAVQRLLAKQQIAAQDVAYIVHGTTVATNAIIEGKVAPTGFITTEGFRDMLEIARQIRPTLYDLQFEKPRPLVPRHRCFGVPERLDAQGQVLTPLDEDASAPSSQQAARRGRGVHRRLLFTRLRQSGPRAAGRGDYRRGLSQRPSSRCRRKLRPSSASICGLARP